MIRNHHQHRRRRIRVVVVCDRQRRFDNGALCVKRPRANSQRDCFACVGDSFVNRSNRDIRRRCSGRNRHVSGEPIVVEAIGGRPLNRVADGE